MSDEQSAQSTTLTAQSTTSPQTQTAAPILAELAPPSHIQSAPKVKLTERERVQHQIRRHWFRALGYLSFNAFVLVVYSGALLADYLLYQLMWWLIREDAQKYLLLSQALDFAKIGLGLLFIVAAVVHGGINTFDQLRRDLKNLKDEDEPDHDQEVK